MASASRAAVTDTCAPCKRTAMTTKDADCLIACGASNRGYGEGRLGQLRENADFKRGDQGRAGADQPPLRTRRNRAWRYDLHRHTGWRRPCWERDEIEATIAGLEPLIITIG